MTVFRAATLRTFFFAFHAGAKEFKDNFTTQVILIDEVSTARFGAAWLSLLKKYRAPIVHTPGDVTSSQES